MKMLNLLAGLALLLILFGCGAITADMMPKAQYYTEEVAQDFQPNQVKDLKVISRHSLWAESIGYESGFFYLINELFLPFSSAQYYISFSLYGDVGCETVDLLEAALKESENTFGKWAGFNYCHGPSFYEVSFSRRLQDKHLASFRNETAGLQKIEVIRKVETAGLKERSDLPIQIKITTASGKEFFDFILRSLRLDLSEASLKTYQEAFHVSSNKASP